MATVAQVVRRLRAVRVPSWVLAEGWFDASWYCERYPDVAASGLDPLLHFWRHGRFQGRNPAAHVDVALHEAMHPSARIGGGLRQMRRGRVRDERVPELESGLFDTDWYVRRYPAAALEQHPLVHYYRECRGGVPTDPGPLFDTSEYVRRHPSASSSSTPLAHLVRRGGQWVVMAAPSSRGEVIRPRIGVRRRADVAVMIHAFHVDVLEELLRAVRPFRRSATVMVSVCDPAEVRVARRLVSRVLGHRVRRTVRLVPNRGRNFGPLLCAFGAEVARHDLVLHLHTKKSLYSGTERMDWRDHLVRSLAGPAGTAALDVFATRPEVGVVQPAQFHVMPPWSAHWLGNVPHGRQVFARCGLDPAEVDGYVDYPVGGMFWARVDAVRPLLDAGFTVDDFEPEAGQTDCTLAHAIERSITAVARSRGYGFVEMGRDEAQWRLNWSRRGTDDFGVHDRELLRRQLADADLVSVDLFDTLLLRPTLQPTSLQYFAARTLTGDGGVADDMVRRRIEAEHAARVRLQHLGDVTLAEVYDEMGRDERVMMDAEIAIEPRVAVPRRWLLDDLRAAGRRMVLVTDTTLDRSTIAALLDVIGAADLFSELYVSNEQRARKDTGSIWPLIAEREGVAPDRWLHIGDNERSDAQRALEHRLCWSHVPSPRAVAQFHGPLPRGNWATMSALGLSATVIHDGAPVTDPDVAFGRAVLGPLLASFLGALAARRRERPDERMLLLARDAELVHRAARSVGLDTDYFAISRRAALGATNAVGADLDLLLDSGAFTGDLRDLVEARTGFRPDERHAVDVDHPRERDRVRALLDGLADDLVAHGRRQQAGLRAHMRGLGIADDTPLCLVDLGYSATTQRALARLLPNPVSGLYCATTPAGAAAGATGWFADGAPFWSGNWFLDHSLLLEALLSGVEGPVLGYGDDGSVMRGPTPAVDVDRIEHVRGAALGFCDDLVRMFGPAVITDVVDPSAVMQWVVAIPDRFLPAPEVIFAGLRIENGFVGRTDDDAAAAPGRRSVDRTSGT